jgi:hypothetical protein
VLADHAGDVESGFGRGMNVDHHDIRLYQRDQREDG